MPHLPPPPRPRFTRYSITAGDFHGDVMYVHFQKLKSVALAYARKAVETAGSEHWVRLDALTGRGSVTPLRFWERSSKYAPWRDTVY